MTWFADYAAAWHKRNRVTARMKLVRQVYCIAECAGSPVKIGISTDAVERMKGLQASTWRPIALYWFGDGSVVHEAALKHILRTMRVHGEWFDDGDNIVKSAMVGRASQADLERLICQLAEEFSSPLLPPSGQRPKPIPVHIVGSA